MLIIDAARPSVQSYITANTLRVQQSNAIAQLAPTPASALASPAETARISINQAAFYPILMAPTNDGIFSVGAVSVKVGAISPARGTSSWGF